MENIVAPAITNRSAAFYSGKIISANEKSNTCTVRYINANGITVTQKNVPVQLSNVNIIDWFPKENDKVKVIEKEGLIAIEGPIYTNSYASIRSTIELTEDIYSDSSNYFMGGYIY